MEQQTDQGTVAPSAGPAAAPEPVSGSYAVAGLEVSSAGKRIGAAILEGVLATVTLGVGWLIWSLVLFSKGTSPAKSLMKMRVVTVADEKLAGFGTMFVREIVGKGILGFLQIFSLFMLFGASRQTIPDKIAKTIVVNDPNGRLA